MLKRNFLFFFLFLCLHSVGARAAGLPTPSICDAVPGNLVANCGFETGNFNSWSISGNDAPLSEGDLYGIEGMDPFDMIAPNSGSFQAYFLDLVSNATTLSQSLATSPGAVYAVSWFLAQDTQPTPPFSNEFSVSFGGNTLLSVTALPEQGYTSYSLQATASSAASVLTFTLGNDPGEFLLDDISVAPVAEPGSFLLLFSPSVFLALRGRKPLKLKLFGKAATSSPRK